MASSGTLLSDLEDNNMSNSMNNSNNSNNSNGNNDDEFVKKILSDINTGNSGNNMIMSPNPNTVSHVSMDSRPATSHVIGNEQPTPGDFAAAMHGMSRQQQPQQQLPPQQPWINSNQGYQNQPNQSNQQNQEQYMDMAPKKNMYSQIADELKTPVLVTLLVFVFSLPFINVLFQHYIPSLVKATGDMTSIGLLLKSVLAGGTFWILQRVVAPLISL